MLVKLSKWQTRVWGDKHRFIVIAAGRRVGKSTFAALKMIDFATKNKESITYYISPTYRQSETIMWRMVRNYLPQSAIEKTNETKLEITLKNGSTIFLKGADADPDALRGVRIDYLICDEVASFRNWNTVWDEVLRPTLIDSKGAAVFISTPKGFNHFYTLYNTKDEDFISFKYTSYDNPYIEKTEIDKAKTELTENTFAQEFLADFRKYTGLIYKEFDRAYHVISPFDIPSGWSVYRGFDFGSNNPTAVLWIAVDNDDNWFIADEHYSSGQTIDYHAGVVNSNQLSSRVMASYGDPSGAQWIQEFAEKGVYITSATKETGQSFEGWVRVGIDKVAQKLKIVPGHVVSGVRLSKKEGINTAGHNRGLPSLYVFDTCQNTIKEFELYRWKEKKQEGMNEPEQPEKANDHLLDSLRYFAVSYKRPVDDLDEVPHEQLFQKGGFY